jgi:H+/Cl- antiporter ClcA
MYLYGGIVGYNKKVEAAVKAFFSAIVAFTLYVAPLLLLEITSSFLFLIIVVWACFWFYIIYRQAIGRWRRVIR